MRVAVVNQHPSDVIGGSELQCDLVARGLVARGHDVIYIAVGRDAAADAPDAPYPLVPAVREPAALARSVLATRPDVVYWRFNRRGLREVAATLRAVSVPLVVALAHVDDVNPWPSRPWPVRGSSLRDRGHDLRARLQHRRQLAAYRDVTAVASQRADLVGRVPHVAAALQRHVPNIMDGGLADGPSFDHPRPYVAWVANLKPRKRPDLLPALADALAPHGVDLVVAGPAQDARYAWLTRPLPDHPNLHHVGALGTREVVALVAGARCLAVTAMPEGFSNAMIQAWWAGTPTVTLDYDPDGLVAAERLGAVADGDVAGFHAEVVRFATDDAAAREAGARAARLARDRFGAEGVLDALERLLTDAVDTRPVSGRRG